MCRTWELESPFVCGAGDVGGVCVCHKSVVSVGRANKDPGSDTEVTVPFFSTWRCFFLE